MTDPMTAPTPTPLGTAPFVEPSPAFSSVLAEAFALAILSGQYPVSANRTKFEQAVAVVWEEFDREVGRAIQSRINALTGMELFGQLFQDLQDADRDRHLDKITFAEYTERYRSALSRLLAPAPPPTEER